MAPVTIKRPRKWIYSCKGRPKSCQVILKAEKFVLFGNYNASKIWLYQLLPASPFSSAKWNYFKMERSSKGRQCITDVIWRNEGSIVYINDSRNTRVSFFKKKSNSFGFFVIVILKASPFMYQLLHKGIIKKIPMSGRRKEPILGYVSKNYEKIIQTVIRVKVTKKQYTQEQMVYAQPRITRWPGCDTRFLRCTQVGLVPFIHLIL